ncbi:MAG: hypothetical protein RBG13Loki_3845 [Promethearchaeota archaeon CR_4]|nr:MAG: hypothetical protein RBG13Loki_3845 [Candidatus Lokiarchaeota archaeon CR_4]
MKVVLINVQWNPGNLKYLAAIPLGITYLGTVLKNNGFSVYLLDATAKEWSNERVFQWVQQIQPEVVGFGVLTSSFLLTIDLVKIIKEWNPSIKIVLGNYFATIEGENIIRKYGNIVDFCVRGEAETTLLKLCQWIEKTPDKDPYEIKGLTFRDHNQKTISTPDRPLEMDLDKIPFPDRKLIKFNYTVNISGIEIPNSKFTSVVSSRGCPYNCSYCACSKFAKQRWRPRSPNNVVEELALLAEQGYTDVHFVDDNFTLRADRVIEICKLMKKENIDLNWHTDGRTDQASPEMFHWMHKAGCRLIWLGFESVNQRMLNIYNKKTKASQFTQTIRNIRKGKIELVIGVFMIGGPTETLEEIKRTLYYGTHADLDFPIFFNTLLYSGVKLWENAIAQGLISPDDIVEAIVNRKPQKVERWETITPLEDISKSPQEKEEVYNLLREANRSIFSFRRFPQLLKCSLRYLRSRYLVTTIRSVLAQHDGAKWNAFRNYQLIA